MDQPERLQCFVSGLPGRAPVLGPRVAEIAYCVKAATGEVVYEQRLDRAGQFYSSALLADGRLYYVTRDGKTFVVAAQPQFEQLAVNDLSDGGVFNASPAVAGQRLLIRSDKFLYCVGTK